MPRPDRGRRPAEAEVLPDLTARLEIGSIAAAALADPRARALFAHLTAAVEVSDDEVADYHARNPMRFAAAATRPDGCAPGGRCATVGAGAAAITAHLPGAARRRAFRMWLDERRRALVRLAPATSTRATRVNPTTPTGTDRMLTLALDVGGTTIAAGLVDPAGALVHTATRSTPNSHAPKMFGSPSRR
ncbi:putative malonyl CoA-acyl carrier protein transacylase, FabD2 [Mycobacterium xenopi 3993]|nr:putative malonyl CoA-acyl carrier protein transacylase, FabD2 [Mycobacterium xenopi 3993]